MSQWREGFARTEIPASQQCTEVTEQAHRQGQSASKSSQVLGQVKHGGDGSRYREHCK